MLPVLLRLSFIGFEKLERFTVVVLLCCCVGSWIYFIYEATMPHGVPGTVVDKLSDPTVLPTVPLQRYRYYYVERKNNNPRPTDRKVYSI